MKRCGATKTYIRRMENTGQRGGCHADFDWLINMRQTEGGGRGQERTCFRKHDGVSSVCKRTRRCLPNMILKNVQINEKSDIQ